jgi:hypothetical protein
VVDDVVDIICVCAAEDVKGVIVGNVVVVVGDNVVAGDVVVVVGDVVVVVGDSVVAGDVVVTIVADAVEAAASDRVAVRYSVVGPHRSVEYVFKPA